MIDQLSIIKSFPILHIIISVAGNSYRNELFIQYFERMNNICKDIELINKLKNTMMFFRATASKFYPCLMPLETGYLENILEEQKTNLSITLESTIKNFDAVALFRSRLNFKFQNITLILQRF